MTTKNTGKARRVIQRSSPLPIYRQVADLLERDVIRGRARGGKVALSSESELAAEFGVSRVTVRQALDRLHFKGLIYSEKGRGSYVRSHHIGGVTGFGSFSAEVEDAGSRPSSIVVGFSTVTALPEAMKRHLVRPLQAPDGFHCLARVRLVDDKPVAFEETYLPIGTYPGLTADDVATGSLYSAMQRHWGLEPAWADAALEPGVADAALARHLDIPEGAPVVIAWRVTSTDEDVVLEYVRSVYRGDGFALTIRRHKIG